MKHLSLIFIALSIWQISYSQIVDIESTTQGVVIPRMSTAERLSINPISGNGSGDDGLMVYDNTEHLFYYYDGVQTSWIKLQGVGLAGTDGPQGPIGNSAVGQQGPEGIEGFSCWDLNINRFKDPNEDVNNDGEWDAKDCKGPTGPQGNPGPNGVAGASGVQGATGDVGAKAVFFTRIYHTTTSSNTSGAVTVMPLPLFETATIFVEYQNSTNPTDNDPVNVEWNGTKWTLRSHDGSDLALSVTYRIIVY